MRSILFLIVTSLLTACGADNQNNTKQNASNGSEPSEQGSYINYLKTNHDQYSDFAAASSQPLPQTINGDQIYWDINAGSPEHAAALATHIGFMSDALYNNQIPRSWDKLFVLEAFLHEDIETTVETDGNRVTIYKTAATPCALLLIQTHASAVSNEFFATGDVSTDHSAAADTILSSAVCDSERSAALTFIEANWQPRS
jgi:hypothetical protein